MARKDKEKYWTQAWRLWNSRQYVLVRYPLDLDLEIRIPADFVSTGGDNTLGFVQYLAQTLVEEPGVLLDSSQPEVDLDFGAAPQTKDLVTYSFVPGSSRLARLCCCCLADPAPTVTGTSFTESRGPQSAHQIEMAPPGDDEGDGASSVFSTSSAEQETRFKYDLVSRDSWCPFTKSKQGACEATHLVPAARLDVRSFAVRLTPERPSRQCLPRRFTASSATSTRRTKPNSACSWTSRYTSSMIATSVHSTTRCVVVGSVTPIARVGEVTAKSLPVYEDDAYYFHTFHPTDKKVLRDCHGMAYKKADMRVQDPNDYPNPVLCEWHYRQCVMMRLRGYSVRMAKSP